MLVAFALADGQGAGTDARPLSPSLPGPYADRPPVDLPTELRQANYAGGSCMHASLITILRWQGLDELADYWRRNYSGAASVQDLAAIGNRLGLRYAWTTTGDAAFLEWCSQTRRGAAIHFKPAHACSFFGYVKRGGREFAVICDNNHPDRLEYWPKEKFLRAWRSYGGRALTPVYSPWPPRPWVAMDALTDRRLRQWAARLGNGCGSLHW